MFQFPLNDDAGGGGLKGEGVFSSSSRSMVMGGAALTR